MGRGGGQVVSVLTFYFNNPSLNPADTFSFFCKICVCKERKQWGAVIAQWICLRLPSCHPRFESQVHHLHFFHL